MGIVQNEELNWAWFRMKDLRWVWMIEELEMGDEEIEMGMDG
jgi:hypothetical protein